MYLNDLLIIKIEFVRIYIQFSKKNMSQYKQEYFKDLNEINQKIDNGLIEGPGNALELFEEYLKKIIFIGR